MGNRSYFGALSLQIQNQQQGERSCFVHQTGAEETYERAYDVHKAFPLSYGVSRGHMNISTQIPSVNCHLWKPCNMRCRFCFASFQDVGQDDLPEGHLPRNERLAVVEALATAGFDKMNFVGGEPILCPWLPDLIRRAKELELTTSIVTNGRPLDGGPYPYLWLDALTQKVREDGRIVNVSVVVATAVNGEGQREIIGMDVGTSEDGAFWLAFLRSLSARGLSGVELVVSDAHQGLRGAIAAVFGGASWQRCRTHFMTNLLTRVPRRVQPWMATMVRTIYQQPSPDEVHAQLDRVTDQLGDRFPQVASLLDEAGPDILAFSSFPVAHWKKIWSNNPLERLNKEIRRRTDVVGIFPNRPAVRRLVGAVLAEQHDEWAVGRRYLTPAILILNEALPEADLAEATAA